MHNLQCRELSDSCSIAQRVACCTAASQGVQLVALKFKQVKADLGRLEGDKLLTD